MTFEDDARLKAIIAESKRNERDNPAVAADVEFKPAEWTAEEEAALLEKIHGTEAERIDRLVAEYNEQQRKR